MKNYEFLVTAQAYDKTDIHKQTILLHDSFFAETEDQANKMFKNKFQNEFHIIKLYSTIDITTR